MKKQNIQCLRIIGCFGVVLVHMAGQVTWKNPIMSLAGYGSKGVYLFFLISGYVTFLSLEKVENLDCVKYYKGRMVRILPLYYTVMLYWFVLHQFILRDTPGGANSYFKWFRYVFMVNNTLPTDNMFWRNLGTTWTMSCFALFYLLVPVFKKYIKNFKHSIVLWCILFVAGKAVMRIWNVYGDSSVLCLHYFVFGIAAYYAVREGRKKERGYLFLCEMGMLFLLMVYGLYDDTFWLTIFGILLVTSMDFTIHNRFLSKTIEVLDEYTFDIYLIHPLFMGRNLIHTSFIDDNWGKVLTVIIGVTITALLVHNLIEKPIQRKYASSKK